MLNFAEQTGSGAVMIVWSFLSMCIILKYMNFKFFYLDYLLADLLSLMSSSASMQAFDYKYILEQMKPSR